MKKAAVFTLVLLIATSGILSSSEADSLEQVLPSLRGIERISALNTLSRHLARSNQDQSVVYATEAYDLARKINYRKGEAEALMAMSTAEYYRSKYAEAAAFIEKALVVIEILNDSALLFDALNKISINYRMTGKLEESLASSFRALQITEILHDTVSKARMLNTIGGIYKELNDYSKALEYYIRADEIYEAKNHLRGLAQTKNNIGIIHRTNGDYEKALGFYEQSLAIEKQLDNKRGIAQTLNNIGSLYSLMNKYDPAIESFNNSLLISRSINNPESQSVSLNFLGETYMKQGRYDEAVKVLGEMLTISEQTGNLSKKNLAIEQLARAYNQKGDFRQATGYYEKLIPLRDTIHQEHVRAIVAEIEAKYEFDKKAREIESLKQENQIQTLQLNNSRIIIYSLAGLTLTVVFIGLLLIQRNKLRLAKKTAELEQKLFRSQMNPHFIFNALHTIQSYIFKNNPGEAGRYLSSFAKLIRQVLTNSRQEYVTLTNEISTLEYYLQLQQLRYHNKFKYHLIVDPAIHTDLVMIPPMLAQPFIENSIEHGIQEIEDQGYINVSFKLTNGSILLEVTDNGIGIEQSKMKKYQHTDQHESLALVITEERIKLMNKTRNKKIELNVKDLKSEDQKLRGTAVSFQIPYLTYEQRNN